MSIVWLVISICCLLNGILFGLMMAPRLLRKKYDNICKSFKAQINSEDARYELRRKSIAEKYQKIVKKEMYNYMLTMAEPPSKDMMN